MHDKVLLGNRVLDALEHRVYDADMVRLGLIVSEPRRAVVFLRLGPPPPRRGVPVAFYDPVVQHLVQGFHSRPFCWRHVELCEDFCGLVAVVCEQGELWDGVVVDVGVVVIVVRIARGLISVLLRRRYRWRQWRERAHLQAEIDSVLVRRFPFYDVRVGARRVLRADAREDQAVVAVFQGRQHVAEHHFRAVRLFHLFHQDFKRLSEAARRVGFQEIVVWF